MHWDSDRVRQNARQATTEDLLDRITVYRSGMEPEAVEIFEKELHRRGIDQDAIDKHLAEANPGVVKYADGLARKCSFCPRPALYERHGWHRLWGVLPLFPRTYYYCGSYTCARDQ